MPGVGLPEAIILIMIAFIALPSWLIFSKAGYPGWYALAIFIPVFGFLIYFFLAFTEWPIKRELAELKAAQKT